MQLQMVMAPADVIAALQAWLETQDHELNAAVTPTFQANGGILVLLNS